MNQLVILRIFAIQKRVEAFLLAAAILGIALMTIVNVVCRFTLSLSFAVVDEWTEILMIGVCFVGMSYAAGQARHIRMSAIFDALPKRTRQSAMRWIAISTAVLMFALCGYALQYVMTVYQLGAIYPATGVPYFLVFSLAPIGFLLTGIQYTLTAIRNWSGATVYLSMEVAELREGDSSETSGEATHDLSSVDKEAAS